MSQRVKRPNRSEDGTLPVKRRKRPTTEEEEAATLAAAAWQPRPLNDLKSIYNRTTTEAPAELFRKDLISAMKLPDSEPLASDEYWVITDQWKQEWERGVQVPVNPDSLPEPSVTVTCCESTVKPAYEFKLPKNKYIRITKDHQFKSEEHSLSNAPAQSEAACSYDLDECDVSWLKILNAERAAVGLGPVFEDQLERVIERFEINCWDKIQSILRNEEGLGIEYDENVICDVCRSPDSEEGNEMVFCDSCNICVHQACYGITRIPEGQWLCCTCALSQRPECVLCPNKGGAMKCTRSGQKWAHVSCALWIPEVSIGCVEKMEPITKISSIPQSRWALICVLCRERVGACIQCSVKTCKTAYHVTCAFKHGLEMRAIIEDENADDGVKLRSYCEKHSKSSKKEKSTCSGSEDDDCKRKKRKDMTSEEKNQARALRLQEIEAEFYKHVSIKDVSMHINVDMEALRYIFNYWKLKRKAGYNKPLLPPKSEDVEMLSHKQEQADLEKMKMFVQLRQDLERVRNLCYMVSRREKLSRTFFRMREQTFHKQTAVLAAEGHLLPNAVVQAVIEANHGPSIYDRLYSHSDAEDHTSDFETILSKIAGPKSPYDSGDEKKPEINGLFKDVKNNPYKNLHFNNGSSKKRGSSLYGSSTSSADERPKDNKENHIQSSDEASDKTTTRRKFPQAHKRPSKIVERRKSRLQKVNKVESSSDEDKAPKKDWAKLSKSRLHQVERDLGLSGTDSDELMPINTITDSHKVKAISSIYSDSSDSSDDDKSNMDSHQKKLRTKAALKEFSQKPSSSANKSPDYKKKVTEHSKKESPSKKKDYDPSDLIVPQRQAAKKASENMKYTTVSRTKEQAAIPETEVPVKVSPPSEEKVKMKVKHKQVKEVKKEVKSADVFDIDKEFEKAENSEAFTYVPQRQAAKKAAEHIKSGLVKPPAPAEPESDKTKKEPELIKPKKESKSETESEKQDSKPKSSSNSSTSSSSSSSGDSSSSSSSDSEDTCSKRKETTTPSEGPFSVVSQELTKRANAKDRPFLDKAAKSKAFVSSSDSSDVSRPSSPVKIQARHRPSVGRKPDESPVRPTRAKSPIRKADKKQQPERKEQRRPSRASRGRARPSDLHSRVGNADVRTGDLSDSECVDVEKVRGEDHPGKVGGFAEEKGHKPNKLRSPIWKTDKKLGDEVDLCTLEREILERKSSRESADAMSKSVFNKVAERSAPRERRNKVSPDVSKESEVSKKLLPKTRSIEDIFARKLSGDISTEPSKKDLIHQPKLNNEIVTEPDDKETYEVAEDDVKEDSTKNDAFETSLNKPQTYLEQEIEAEKKSTSNIAFQNRSIFSPQPNTKDTELLDFDILDDGFNISKDEEIMKVPLTFSLGNLPLFKEDTKEDSARETLNLVEKLRMEMSKKTTSYDVDDSVSVASSTKNDTDKTDFSEQVVPNNVQHQKDNEMINKEAVVNMEMRVEVSSPPKEFMQEPGYKYGPPETMSKNIGPVQHENIDHSTNAQADERWVPPSENYLDNYAVSNYLQPYSDGQQIPNHEMDLRQESMLINNKVSPAMTIPDRRISQTPFTDQMSMDCMPSPMPYANIHPQAKWAESEVMPIRRSSSSSAASTSSSCSQNRNDVEDEPAKRPPAEVVMMNHPGLEIPFGVLQPYPSAMDAFPPFSDAQQFVSPVSLFPPPNINTQLPFSSPGAAMYPPSFGAPFPTAHSVIPPMPKPVMDDTHFPSPCTAAFTSSQHNMALTAAMVNMPPSSVLKESSEDDNGMANFVEPTAPVMNNADANHVETSPSQPQKASNAGKKSPSKPTRTSARFISQQAKSPSKSPGKSPRQELGKQNNITRARGENKRAARGGQSQGRGRGRGRGRARHTMQNSESDGANANTIHNKLVGTVYDLDFDDDMSNDNMTDLRAMRERRKSLDVHERKSEVCKETAESPHKSQKYNSDLRSLKPPTPQSKPEESLVAVDEAPPRAFPDIVQPVLPGPVDMRTYSSTFDPQNYNEANLLGAFASGTADTQVHEDIDEDFEKELHSALTSNNNKVEDPQTPEIGNIKVSLSDSRNQLKVKIKGPIANYTSSVTALPPPPVDSSTASNISVSSVSNNVISSASVNSGTSSLRRMRKKELLRQYWTQDMNMDEPTSTPRLPNTPTVPALNRTIITIPKAVASMTTIPTKDDYRDYTRMDDDHVDVKFRKESKKTGNLSRELRHLDTEEDILERKRSMGSHTTNNAANVVNNSFDSSLVNKRRGRPPRPSQSATPKLKIKISNNSIVGSGKLDERRDRIRPPKKRLANITMPSVEDLKRESMKFRKRVMADFSEEKRKKKEKNSKRKKRKPKPQMQIVSDNITNSMKMIIRIGKKNEGDNNNGTGPSAAKENAAENDEKPLEKVSTAEATKEAVPTVNQSDSAGECSALRIVSTNKVTPLKLKLSRSQEGVGYVMKSNDQTVSDVKNCESVTAPATLPSINLPDPVHTSNPLPLNKDCEVR